MRTQPPDRPLEETHERPKSPTPRNPSDGRDLDQGEGGSIEAPPQSKDLRRDD